MPHVVHSRIPRYTANCTAFKEHWVFVVIARLLVVMFLLEVMQVVCRRGVESHWVGFLNRRYRSSEPCIVVFQVVALRCMRFFIFHELVQVIFPSLGWSSCFSLRSRHHDKS